ncbi:MAG: sigma-70 family RNA polymerase sigma factor [Clostridia bacterium]|nr:sigma-70 family RNA polymerase sigma factor [Clostridia bacterium]
MSEAVAEYKSAELLGRYKNGETFLESQILEENMGLVRASAYRLLRVSYYGADFDDLCQIGSIGLLKAIRRFDMDRGVVFSTYAVPMIIGEMRKFLRDDGPIKVGRKLKEQHMAIRRAKETLSLKLGRDPLLSELEEETGISREDIIMALDSAAVPESLDSPINTDGDMFFSDVLGDEGSLPDIDKMALKDSLRSLSDEERKLISLRYFLSKTQQETANILGITQVQVSRKEKKIIEKLRLLM